MDNWQERTELLMGEEKSAILASSHVLIVGTGGVGAYAAEMICRAGIGQITLVDADNVAPSNINRQLVALHSTIGKPKIEILSARLLDINPDLKLTTIQKYLKDDAIPELLDSEKFDFIIDAIDTIAPKAHLLEEAIHRHIKIVSSMGAGAKTDITQIRFADLWDTYHCGLSKAIRKYLKKMGLKNYHIPVVFSTQAPDDNAMILIDNEQNKKSTVGTISYMPATFGCYLAEYVIRKLTQRNNK